MAHVNILFFIQLVFFVVQSDCRDEIISASVEEDVSLNCFHPKLLEAETCTRVKLTKLLPKTLLSKVVLARPQTTEFPDATNIKWEPGKNIVLLSKIQKSHEGVYRCEIWSGWTRVLDKNITLNVKECPSKVQRVALGSPVTLSCSESTGLRNLSWSMLKGGNPVSLPKRFQVSRSTLSIRSAWANCSGWYRCQYWLEDTQRCTDINLLVQEASTESTTLHQVSTDVKVLSTNSGEGFTVAHAAAVVVVVVVLVIAAVVGAVLYWKYSKEDPQGTSNYEDFVEYSVTYDVVADELPPKDGEIYESTFPQQNPDSLECTL